MKYIQENNPLGIVAVACQKELEEGVHSVKELTGSDELVPPVVIIPLTRDGCVDTEVDEEQALGMIASGCYLESVKGRAR